MHKVEPNVFLIAETKTNNEELEAYLKYIGASGWNTDAPSDIEEIIEVMGRECYRSFFPGLNPNVTKVRTENKSYIENIIASKHGSVVEHSWASFMFCDVSRIFTHECVRHRAGTAFSQESLRYVRLDDVGLWIPSCFQNNKKAIMEYEQAWKDSERHYNNLLLIAAKEEYNKKNTFGELEKDEVKLIEFWNKLPFETKKKYTSAFRRVAPEGLATNIGVSFNIRALRHIIEDRTDPGAEEEIRLVFSKVAKIAQEKWPNLFSDYEIEIVDNLPWYKTKNRKV